MKSPNMRFLSFSEADNHNLDFLSFSKADILKMTPGRACRPKLTLLMTQFVIKTYITVKNYLFRIILRQH